MEHGSAMVAGPDGAMWFTRTTPQAIGRISMGGTISAYSTGSGNIPISMTVGPDSNLWFTLFYGHGIGRITPSGFVSIIPVQTLEQHAIATGPLQGAVRNLWLTAGQAKIYEVSTKGRVIAKFTTPTPHSFPTAIAEGPDGNMWFVEFGANKIGRLTPSGVFTEFPLPNLGGYPRGIAVCKDGNLYTVESAPGVGKLVRISTAGAVTAIDIGDTQPTMVAAGPDGNPWFYAEYHGLGYFDITKHKVHHFGYPPNALFNHNTAAIGAGPDGNIWMPIVNDDGSQNIDVFVRRIMSANPSNVTLAVGQSQTVTVSEKKYSGLWTAASSNEQIATVAPGSTKDTFVVTASGQGNCIVTIADLTQNTIEVSVAVH